MKLTLLLFLYTLPSYINGAPSRSAAQFRTNTGPATIKQAPYQVGLVIQEENKPSSFVCGGSLLSPTSILTAAHCFNDTKYLGNKTTVVLGANWLYLDGIGLHPSKVVVHHDWNPKTHRNDLAMVHLPPNLFNLSDAIKTIRLPTGPELNQTFEAEIADVSGYGITHDGLKITLNQEVNEVSVPIISHAECKEKYNELVSESHICTSKHSLMGTCTGDSGGPLVVHRNGEPVLVGVVSFGDKKCEKDRPDVFVRVTSYIDWIKDNLTP